MYEQAFFVMKPEARSLEAVKRRRTVAQFPTILMRRLIGLTQGTLSTVLPSLELQIAQVSFEEAAPFPLCMTHEPLIPARHCLVR